MFNRPDVFGRKENPPAPTQNRRDAVPVLNSTSLANSTSAERSAAAAKVGAANSPISQPSAASPDAATAHTVANAPASLSRDLAVGEEEPGARLLVGRDVKLKGAEILDCDTLVVEGRVEATMDSRLLRIAANGSFAGKVSIDVAEIYGSFEGELTARSQLVIHSTGRVSGTIRFGKLVVDEGGELNGDISVISSKSAAPQVVRPAAEGIPTRSANAG